MHRPPPGQAELEGILLGCYLADHLPDLAQGEASNHLFRLLDSTLQALAARVGSDLATRYFKMKAVRLVGPVAPARAPRAPPRGAYAS
jgi:hypothetical protein